MDVSIVILIVFALGLAMVNGGNDNLKGVATLIRLESIELSTGLDACQRCDCCRFCGVNFSSGWLVESF